MLDYAQLFLEVPHGRRHARGGQDHGDFSRNVFNGPDRSAGEFPTTVQQGAVYICAKGFEVHFRKEWCPKKLHKIVFFPLSIEMQGVFKRIERTREAVAMAHKNLVFWRKIKYFIRADSVHT